MAFFFFNDTATTEIYTLSLHDALPIYVAGFRWGRDRGYAVLVEMDADGSHHPEQLPALLAALVDADLVLGSRCAPGGRVADWPGHRLLASRAGNLRPRWSVRLPLAARSGRAHV